MFKSNSRNDQKNTKNNDLISGSKSSKSPSQIDFNNESIKQEGENRNFFRKNKKKNSTITQKMPNNEHSTNRSKQSEDVAVKKQSLKKNLSKSFNNLISGFRKSMNQMGKSSRNEAASLSYNKSKSNSNSLTNVSYNSVLDKQLPDDFSKVIKSKNVSKKYIFFIIYQVI